MMMRELFYDFDRPSDDNGIFWCKQVDPPVEVGQTVMFGSDGEKAFRQGTVVEVRDDMVGVAGAAAGSLSA